MKDKKNAQKNIIKKEDYKNEINDIKEEEIDSKENISNLPVPKYNANTIIKDKNADKNLLIKTLENQKGKTLIKNSSESENINKRLNNFINYSNINIHNRYYSTNISDHFFRNNFINKLNYNKNRYNNLSNENNDIQYNKINNNNYNFNENQIRPYSFTSRSNNFKNNYINKGLNYILGNTNPNNISQKAKMDGYYYKKYNRGRRNNYVNKNIFFNNNNNIKKFDSSQNNDIIFNNNINNVKTNQIININSNDNIQYSIPFNSSEQNVILMNDIFKLNNLDINIMSIGNDILNFITNKISDNQVQKGFNNNMINTEIIPYETLLKIANSHNSDVRNYFSNISNMAYNNISMKINMKGNTLFG